MIGFVFSGLKSIFLLPKMIGKMLIRIYQFLFSFDHSFWAKYINYRVCLHYPSCSEYTYQAIDKFGLIRGSLMGFFRILRCNPHAKHRHDPVPNKFSIKANPPFKVYQ